MITFVHMFCVDVLTAHSLCRC